MSDLKNTTIAKWFLSMVNFLVGIFLGYVLAYVVLFAIHYFPKPFIFVIIIIGFLLFLVYRK